MNYKHLIGWIGLGVLSFGYSQAHTNTLTRKGRPNIIYIVADDLGLGEIGCYGQKLIETPNIDALAKSGMIFSNHYSGQSVSAPSRCSLLTGLHCGHAFIRGNDAMASRGDVWSHRAMLADASLEGQRPLPGNTVMVSHKLKEAGYTTACIGKWGLGYPGSESAPNKMGFDFFYGYNCQRQAHNYFPPFLYRNEQRVYLNNQLLEPNAKLDKNDDPLDPLNYEQFVQQDYAPDLMYKEVLKFVDQNRRKPFALFWMTPLPHVPLQAPEKWVAHYHDKFGEEKPYTGGNGYFPCRYPKATYAAMVSYLDEQVGGLVQRLKDLDLYENTLIVFTSDNGPSYNGGTNSTFFNSAFPHKSCRGWGKGSLHEGGIHVPMIAAWPKEIEAGSSTDLLSAFWDVMPTLCELAEVESPTSDGLSMLPTLLGKKRKQKKHEFLYWENPGKDGQKAVRIGKWKAFVGNLYKSNKLVQLYDLSVDPAEEKDVSAENPTIMKQVLHLFKTEHSVPVIKSFDLPDGL